MLFYIPLYFSFGDFVLVEVSNVIVNVDLGVGKELLLIPWFSANNLSQNYQQLELVFGAESHCADGKSINFNFNQISYVYQRHISFLTVISLSMFCLY